MKPQQVRAETPENRPVGHQGTGCRGQSIGANLADS